MEGVLHIKSDAVNSICDLSVN